MQLSWAEIKIVQAIKKQGNILINSDIMKYRIHNNTLQ